MLFGEKLKQLRNRLELSQPELAESAGIEQSYLSKLENGRSLPSPEVLNKLVQALAVSLDELLDGIDEKDEIEKLSAIPQIATHIQVTQIAQQRVRSRWLFTSLALMCIGLVIVFAGMAALLYPDINFQYEYASGEIVPKGESGQIFDTTEAFVRYLEGSREEQPGDRSFLVRVNDELQKLGALNSSLYQIEEEFVGSMFHREANESELAILASLGFENGGSRLFELTERHTLFRPENGYLIFLGWLMIALGTTGFLYTLVSRMLNKQ